MAEIAIAEVRQVKEFQANELKVFAPSEAAPTSSAVPLDADFSQWEPSDDLKPYWVVAPDPAGTRFFFNNTFPLLAIAQLQRANGVRYVFAALIAQASASNAVDAQPSAFLLSLSCSRLSLSFLLPLSALSAFSSALARPPIIC